VARAKFRRAKYSERRRVTKAVQVVDDFSQPQADVSLDVLEKAEPRSENGNSSCDAGPEVTRVFLSEALAGCGERLARIASREDIHAVAKLFPRERPDIRPDRSRINLPAFHSRK
jgi:hypothetical protein